MTISREQAKKQYHIIMNITTNMLQYLGDDDAREFIRIMKKLAAKSPEDFM